MCLTPTNSNVIRSPPPPHPFSSGEEEKKSVYLPRAVGISSHQFAFSAGRWLVGWLVYPWLLTSALSLSRVSYSDFFKFFFSGTCYMLQPEKVILPSNCTTHTQTYTYTHNITPGRGYLTFFLYEPACDDCDDDDDDDDDGANLCM